MADYTRKAGSTSVVLGVFIPSTAGVAGEGLAGLVFNTSNLSCYYKRENGTAGVVVPLATIATLGTWETGGFKQIDNTNMIGWYEFHPPDLAMASGAKWVVFDFKGAADMPVVSIRVELTAYDPQDAVRLGLTSIPNIVQGNAGQLPTADASGRVDVSALGGSTADLAALRSMCKASTSVTVNDAGATTTVAILAAANGDTLSTSDSFYSADGMQIVFTSGALKGIQTKITAYVGATKSTTWTPALPSAPANGVSALIIGRSG